MIILWRTLYFLGAVSIYLLIHDYSNLSDIPLHMVSVLLTICVAIFGHACEDYVR